MVNEDETARNQLMLSLCRNDQEEQLAELVKESTVNANYKDGAGNTAAHYAANSGAIGCLEVLVNLDEIDLDIKNALEGDTPLHKAVQFQETDVPMAVAMVELLLAGGADPSILNRNKLTALQLVHPQNTALKELLEQGATSYQMDDSDIADDDAYGDEDDQASD
ncbi:ankyrin repeat-containing domain protein [Syncephalastrum racemosum]|uniref:Ankyrin repeat-containing domain protein n=1 Tax=Syncephalastrum racemosum TaxID=13706 RepID=A0A1X2H0V3_SYNRA|nr:ankyrin repeat-containing domain protein [Syncephalastrum racemosum]